MEGSLRNYVSKETMIGKAYYAALVLVPSHAPLKFNAAEVIDIQWMLLNEVAAHLTAVDSAKSDILATGLESSTPDEMIVN